MSEQQMFLRCNEMNCLSLVRYDNNLDVWSRNYVPNKEVKYLVISVLKLVLFC